NRLVQIRPCLGFHPQLLSIRPKYMYHFSTIAGRTLRAFSLAGKEFVRWSIRPDRGRLVGLFLVNAFTIIAGWAALVTYRTQAINSLQVAARDEFTSVYTNLGSDKLFERLGALQQVPDVMFRKSPSLSMVNSYAFGQDYDQVYFDRSKRALVNYLRTKPDVLASDPLTQTEFIGILEALAKIGRSGWKEGRRVKQLTKAEALDWIWSSDPEKGSLDWELRNALSKLPLRELNLEDVGFQGASLSTPDFTNCNLDSANFTGARLRAPRFDHCSFVGGNFDKIDTSHAIFTSCEFSSSRFLGASIDGAIFSNCKGLRVSFSAGLLLTNLGAMASDKGQFSGRQMSLDECMFGDTDFSKSHLNGWRVKNSSLSGCDFTETDCSDLLFASSSLTDCAFDEANLQHVHFEDCVLRRCSFKKAIFDRGSFTDVGIYNSNFSGATFRNVVLASFVPSTKETKFAGAIFEQSLNLSESDILKLRSLGAVLR
ncbi:MAG: hypothetical protein JWM68_1798, partial [Verrucomicrobiales bacterium]|nr:hypothetical protein [Verrucomicrobiales bacterium]